jgi:hypothetical protein
VEPKRFFFSIFFLTYVIIGLFDTIGDGANKFFDGNCWKYDNASQQNINTCLSSNLVVGGGIPNKIKGKIQHINNKAGT